MLTYVFDLDGTLFSIKPFVQFFNQQTNQKLKIRDVTIYDFYELYHLTGKQKAAVRQLEQTTASKVFFQQTPNQSLLKAIHTWLHQGINIVFLTARDLKWQRVTQSEISCYLGVQPHLITDLDQPISNFSLIMNQQFKQSALLKINSQRFFDDKLAIIDHLMTVNRVHQQYELTLVDAPYNQNCRCDSRCYFIS